MDINATIPALSALAQDSRLRVFRLLVERGEAGMAAGEIARHLGIPHNTMSSHLGVLSHAGLVRSRRAGRSIIYTVDFPAVRALFAYLLQDCCRMRADVCDPLLDAALSTCCP
jgi:DNA-binding transcriptional ArsR family regulator